MNIICLWSIIRRTKGIADSDSEEETAADWVMKHQKLLQEKERAEQRVSICSEIKSLNHCEINCSSKFFC